MADRMEKGLTLGLGLASVMLAMEGMEPSVRSTIQRRQIAREREIER